MVQRGTARLHPAIGATVATLTLANNRHKAWTARLSVGSCESVPAYAQVRSASR